MTPDTNTDTDDTEDEDVQSEVSLWRNDNPQKVGIQIAQGGVSLPRKLIHADEARALADDIEAEAAEFGLDQTDTDSNTMTPDTNTDTDNTEDEDVQSEVSLWRNYNQQKVGIQIAHGGVSLPRKLIHPDEARVLADDIEAEAAEFGLDQTDTEVTEIADRLRQYADDVDPRKSRHTDEDGDGGDH